MLQRRELRLPCGRKVLSVPPLRETSDMTQLPIDIAEERRGGGGRGGSGGCGRRGG